VGGGACWLATARAGRGVSMLANGPTIVFSAASVHCGSEIASGRCIRSWHVTRLAGPRRALASRVHTHSLLQKKSTLGEVERAVPGIKGSRSSISQVGGQQRCRLRSRKDRSSSLLPKKGPVTACTVSDCTIGETDNGGLGLRLLGLPQGCRGRGGRVGNREMVWRMYVRTGALLG